MKYLSLLIIILGISLGNSDLNKVNESYPTIFWKFEIYDEDTKEHLKGVEIYKKIHHEFIECQGEFTPAFIIKISEHQLKDNEELSIERKLKLENELEEAKKDLERDKELNTVEFLDTSKFDSPYSTQYLKPFKKYKIKIIHPEYQTVELSDSFPVCKMSLHTKIGLKKKEK